MRDVIEYYGQHNIRLQAKHLQAHACMGCAAARALHFLPQVGAAWRLQGTQAESLTPGTTATHSLAGALHLVTGRLLNGLGPRKNHGVLRDLCTLLDATYPTPPTPRIEVVVDNDGMHQAKAVEPGWAPYPRLTLLWLPT